MRRPKRCCRGTVRATYRTLRTERQHRVAAGLLRVTSDASFSSPLLPPPRLSCPAAARIPRKRWRRRKEAGETLPPHQRHPRAKTARKPKQPPTATSKQHARPSHEPPSTSPTTKDTNVVDPGSTGGRQMRESASSPAGIPNAAGATAAARPTAVPENPAAAVGGEREKVESPRARKRLEQAKELDQEVAARQGGGG